MIKTLLIEKNAEYKSLILNQLKMIENVSLALVLDEFQKERDYGEFDLIIFDLDKKNFDFYISLKEKYPNINYIALLDNIYGNKNANLNSIQNIIIKPVIFEILKNTIEQFNFKRNKAKVFSIFSPKKATGKTTLALNLAFEISRKTLKKVLIIDFNKQNDTQKYLFDEVNIPTQIDFDNLNNTNIEKYFLKYELENDLNLYFLNLSEIKEKQTKIINILKNYFDFIITDCSNITEPKTLEILYNSDLVLLLALLNQKSVDVVQKCYEIFDKINYNNDKIKLIINRTANNSYGEIEEFENKIGQRRVFNTIVNNFLVLDDSINQKIPLYKINPNSNIFKAFSKIADDILKIDFESLQNKNKNEIIFDDEFYALLKRMGD